MKRSLGLAACICLMLLLVTCAPARGARLISPVQNLELSMTIANAALQAKGCQEVFEKNFPEITESAIKIWTDEVWITMFQFDGVIVDADYIAAVVPHINPRRVMVNTTFAGILVPTVLGETLVHEFFHLMDYAFGSEEQGLVTEELSQLRAKACMDAMWASYPEARPDDWVDGPRAFK